MTLGWVVFEFRLAQLKQEFLTRFHHENGQKTLQTFTFTQAESDRLLRWEHAREFEYRGMMYDVIDIQTKGELITYLVWHDAEETNLKTKARNFEQEQSDPHKEAQTFEGTQLVFFAEIPFTIELTPPFIPLNSIEEKLPSWNHFLLAPPQPPPDIF